MAIQGPWPKIWACHWCHLKKMDNSSRIESENHGKLSVVFKMSRPWYTTYESLWYHVASIAKSHKKSLRTAWWFPKQFRLADRVATWRSDWNRKMGWIYWNLPYLLRFNMIQLYVFFRNHSINILQLCVSSSETAGGPLAIKVLKGFPDPSRQYKGWMSVCRSVRLSVYVYVMQCNVM